MNIYSGVVVPMITPFTSGGGIDEAAVGRICDTLLAGGIAGIFPLGTTGEAASISRDDRHKLVAATLRHVNGRAMVYAGIASNCLRESIDAAAAYEQLGAQAAVAHMPSYYPLTDAEIESYLLRLADAVKLPLVLYNIPATTHHQIALDSVDKLRAHPNIVAIKDSAGDKQRLTELLHRAGGRGGFPVLVGSSVNASHGLRHGAAGLVPSGGHLVPREYQRLFEAGMKQDWIEVERLQHLTDAACAQYLKGRSLGQGLAALKAILEQRGLCSRTMAPPLLDHVGQV